MLAIPRLCLALLPLLLLMLSATPTSASAKDGWQRLVVTASAYNSVRRQTDRTPNHGAWGDRIDRLPAGVHAVAVSPDLLKRGLKRKQRIRIKGLPGEYMVLDKTHPRWRKVIDIHMGKDVRKAKRFGRKKVEISWKASKRAERKHKRRIAKSKRSVASSKKRVSKLKGKLSKEKARLKALKKKSKTKAQKRRNRQRD